ncbi:hypothetical protein QYM36_009973 [Artemia franciscana]|uniref:PNT domain-containing protein n=1 Tax=Artemia franciscana TaxID=6661 RepID=A0AA88L184_ARTSF|nr:hypothetical protein QYM36_009973 [Artemia franciscana]
MSLVDAVHTVPSLSSPTNYKMNDCITYSPFGLVPCTTDVFSWEAGSPFFHGEVKWEVQPIFEAASPHSLHSPSPLPIPLPSPSPEIKESNEGFDILKETIEEFISSTKRATQRTHPYQRPSNYKSPTPENSILLSVLSNKCSPKPSYSNHESNHQEAEFKLDIQSLPSLLPIQCSNTSLTVKDAMSDLDTLVWSMADAEIEQVSQRLNIPRNPYTWNRTDVIRWVSHVQEELKLDPVLLLSFDMTGEELAKMNEENFRSRFPKGGSTLYAKFYIWLMAWEQQTLKPAQIPVIDVEAEDTTVPENPFGLESPDSYLPLSVTSPRISNSYLSPGSDFSVLSPCTSTVGSEPTPSPSYYGELKDGK